MSCSCCWFWRVQICAEYLWREHDKTTGQFALDGSWGLHTSWYIFCFLIFLNMFLLYKQTWELICTGCDASDEWWIDYLSTGATEGSIASCYKLTRYSWSLKSESCCWPLFSSNDNLKFCFCLVYVVYSDWCMFFPPSAPGTQSRQMSSPLDCAYGNYWHLSCLLLT